MFTPSHRLVYSLLFGWGLVVYFLVLPLLNLSPTGDRIEFGVWFVALILAIRYATLKPVVKIGLGALGTVATVSFYESIFGSPYRAEREYRSGLIMVGITMIFVLALYLIKAYWYLLKESFVFIKNRKVVIETVFRKKEIKEAI